MEMVATYRKHGWELRTRADAAGHVSRAPVPGSTTAQSSRSEGVAGRRLWFSRLSSHDREAWELRLLEQTQYALFETFEPDETEDTTRGSKTRNGSAVTRACSGSTEIVITGDPVSQVSQPFPYLASRQLNQCCREPPGALASGTLHRCGSESRQRRSQYRLLDSREVRRPAAIDIRQAGRRISSSRQSQLVLRRQLSYPN